MDHQDPKQEGITRTHPPTEDERRTDLLRRKEQYASYNAVAMTAGMIWVRMDARNDEGRNYD